MTAASQQPHPLSVWAPAIFAGLCVLLLVTCIVAWLFIEKGRSAKERVREARDVTLKDDITKAVSTMLDEKLKGHDEKFEGQRKRIDKFEEALTKISGDVKDLVNDDHELQMEILKKQLEFSRVIVTQNDFTRETARLERAIERVEKIARANRRNRRLDDRPQSESQPGSETA